MSEQQPLPWDHGTQGVYDPEKAKAANEEAAKGDKKEEKKK